MNILEYSNINSIIITNKKTKYNAQKLNVDIVYYKSMKVKYGIYRNQMAISKTWITGVLSKRIEYNPLSFESFSYGIIEHFFRKYSKRYDYIILDLGLSKDDMKDYNINEKIIFVK